MKAAVVIVAHPDDEIIWSGGLILSNPDWDWTVLSLCRADDPDRSVRFRAVCERLGLEGIISDLDDGDPPAHIHLRRQIGRRVMDNVGRTGWDLCVTHGTNGEYGHLRHKQVHQEVVSLVGRGMLRSRELWTFAYDCEASDAACGPSGDADILLTLSGEQLRRKKEIVRNEYGYAADSFEVRACISPESFRRKLVSGEELRS